MADNLAHYGVKGMKWGRRKSDSTSSTPSKKPPASEDFARVATLKTKTKKGGTRSLSNKEMQDIVTRMNLEQQYGRLQGQKSFLGRVKNGNEVAKTILAVGATINTAVAFSQTPAGKKLIANLNKKT